MNGIRQYSAAQVRALRDVAEMKGATATMAACERELERRTLRLVEAA